MKRINTREGEMTQAAECMKGLKFKIRKWRFCINTRGVDISNGMRCSFLFHPFNKHFSIKQYYVAYKWLLTDEIKNIPV